MPATRLLISSVCETTGGTGAVGATAVPPPPQAARTRDKPVVNADSRKPRSPCSRIHHQTRFAGTGSCRIRQSYVRSGPVWSTVITAHEWGGAGRVLDNSHRRNIDPRPGLFLRSPQGIGTGAPIPCRTAGEAECKQRVSRRIDQIPLERLFGGKESRRQTLSIERGATDSLAGVRRNGMQVPLRASHRPS